MNENIPEGLYKVIRTVIILESGNIHATHVLVNSHGAFYAHHNGSLITDLWGELISAMDGWQGGIVEE